MEFSACLLQKPRKFIITSTFLTCEFPAPLCFASLNPFLCKSAQVHLHFLQTSASSCRCIKHPEQTYSNRMGSHASQRVYYPRGLSEVPFQMPCQSQICEIWTNFFFFYPLRNDLMMEEEFECLPRQIPPDLKSQVTERFRSRIQMFLPAKIIL